MTFVHLLASPTTGDHILKKTILNLILELHSKSIVRLLNLFIVKKSDVRWVCDTNAFKRHLMLWAQFISEECQCIGPCLSMQCKEVKD